MTILYLFVEGTDDELFAQQIIIPLLRPNFSHIQCYRYKQKAKAHIRRFIESIKHRKEADYLFFADFDTASCISIRKEKLKERHNYLDERQVLIVCEEIESWLVAGSSIKQPYKTDKLTKEQFATLQPTKFVSRIDWLQELLKNFSIDEARKRNASFAYFCDRYV